MRVRKEMLQKILKKNYRSAIKAQSIQIRSHSDIIDFNIKSIIIPFSKFFKRKKLQDIYSGNENIPFKNRLPEYKRILKQEFIERYDKGIFQI